VLLPGTTLGRYEIHSKLGAGGMGEVYLAQDTRLDRKVALKILPDGVAADPDRLKRFEQEAKAASALNHPNIITIYEIDRASATTFIATEFIEGATLRDRMAARPMSPGDVLNVAVQIASALAAAHAHGIVHRDIKPDNIIVRNDGIVKILDFGLSKLTGDGPGAWTKAPTQAHPMTASGVVMGTAAYMSPEQARGQQVDARSDVFSLGVLLYELLTGHLPFDGSSVYEVVAAILSDQEPPPLSRYSSGTPAELDRIVAKTLRKNREERYQTIKDLLLDLQSLKQRVEFERAHSAVSPEVDAVVRAAGHSPRRMRRRLVALALGVLAIGGGASGYAWWGRAHGPSQSDIKSLAVLPLKSLDAGDNYLGMGIADAAIQRVSQTGRVIVRPTSAVRRYLNEDTDALTAAKQLGVDSVLEGSFQRAGNRLRVSVNLLRRQDGASLWSDTFDLQMADIFAVEDTVAQQVASRLRLQLDGSQQAQLTKHYTSNPVAYDFYLRGAYTYDQRLTNPPPMVKSAIGLYTKAIEADPNFALAHAKLAQAYATLAVFLEPTQPAWIEHAKEEIDRAQALDPQLAETHLARFQLLYSEFEGYQGDAAARELLQANRLDPNVGHEQLAYMYNHLGLEDLAAREVARAFDVDPTSEGPKEQALLMYEVQSKYDAYAADSRVRHNGRIEVLYAMAHGRLDDAQKHLDEWAAAQPNQDQLLPTKALLLALKRDFQGAEAQVPIILGKHPRKDPLYHHAAYDIACIYALDGKSADAVKWLRESAVSGYHLYPRYTRDAFLDRIRQSPEFIQFLGEMKTENEAYRREFS
jgi:TolB-like protein